MKWNYLVTLIVGVMILLSCAQPPVKTPAPTPVAPTVPEGIKRIVKVEAEGIVLHYRDESFWSDAEWSVILENKGEFSSNLIEDFINDVSTYGEGRERVASAINEFNEDEKSTVLECDVHGAISKSGDSYQATFFWLLRPLGLDFIDSDFAESENGLFWEGLVNGIPTTISVGLPAIDGSIYKAWAYPVGHCHAHVWWELAP